MRRAGSRPLLRSAIFGLGAGGGMLVTGCLLCGGASAASAQPLAAVAPFPSAHGDHQHANGQHPGNQGGSQAGPPGPHEPHGRTPPGLADRAPGGGSEAGSSQAGQGPHSLHFALTGQLGPQQVTTTTAVSTVSRQAHFVQASAPSAPQNSVSQPSRGNGNGNTGPDNGRSGNAKRTTDTSSKSTGNGNDNGATPSPAPGTPVAETVAVPLPTQRPVRPERIFSLPLAPLSPIPAAGGPVPGSGLPLAPVRKAGSELFRFGASVLPRDWVGESLKESGKLKLPIALMVVTAVFMLVQALIDRRDPKVSDAPERQNDDSVGFG